MLMHTYERTIDHMLQEPMLVLVLGAGGRVRGESSASLLLGAPRGQEENMSRKSISSAAVCVCVCEQPYNLQ